MVAPVGDNVSQSPVAHPRVREPFPLANTAAARSTSHSVPVGLATTKPKEGRSSASCSSRQAAGVRARCVSRKRVSTALEGIDRTVARPSVPQRRIRAKRERPERAETSGRATIELTTHHTHRFFAALFLYPGNKLSPHRNKYAQNASWTVSS